MVEIVLITGHLGTGKTKLAERLGQDHDFRVVRTSDEISQKYDLMAQNKLTREELQQCGAEWDDDTDGKWLCDLIQAVSKKDTKIVVDHVRNVRQLKFFREKPEWQTTHVHLYAPQVFLEDVYGPVLKRENLTYQQADPIQSEEDIQQFRQDADVRINVNRSDYGDTYTRVAARLGLFSEPDRQLVDVLIGGQFGSEGKGHIAAALARNYDLVIRVGGPNAGHTVSSESGKYTYHQLPSGARDFNGKVLLGPGMTIHKDSLLNEIAECEITPDRLCIDPQAMLISEEDKKKETRMRDEIASTGSGSGAAKARRILDRSASPPQLAGQDTDLCKYTEQRPAFCGDAVSELERCFKQGKRILLEGTQGSGLSLYHGSYPHVTSRDTNVAGCLAEAGISPARVRRVIMVVRTTPIRVGNPDDTAHTSGPLKNETTFEIIAKEAGLNPVDVKGAEKTSTTKRDRRVGWFDWEQFRHACMLNTPTDIALTFVDYLDKENRSARRFEQLQEDTIKFVEELERVAQAPVSLINVRFPDLESGGDIRSMIDRRVWR